MECSGRGILGAGSKLTIVITAKFLSKRLEFCLQNSLRNHSQCTIVITAKDFAPTRTSQLPYGRFLDAAKLLPKNCPSGTVQGSGPNTLQ